MSESRNYEKHYNLKIEDNVGITMHDGTRLSAKVYRPEAEGRYPVLLANGNLTNCRGRGDQRTPLDHLARPVPKAFLSVRRSGRSARSADRQLFHSIR